MVWHWSLGASRCRNKIYSNLKMRCQEQWKLHEQKWRFHRQQASGYSQINESGPVSRPMSYGSTSKCWNDSCNLLKRARHTPEERRKYHGLRWVSRVSATKCMKWAWSLSSCQLIFHVLSCKGLHSSSNNTYTGGSWDHAPTCPQGPI